MTKRITNKTIANNIKTSVFVQGISLLVSFILSVIVPAFISELQYSYWQTYLLYVNYVGVLHFGLLDGLMLRYSHYDYEELDKKVISSQFNILFFIVSMFSVIGIYIALWKLEAPTKYIVLFVAIGMVTKNIFTYNSYLFQMTNRIGKYALLIVFQRGVYGCLIVVFLLLDIEWYGWYCIADLLGDIISCLFLRKSNKELYLSKLINVKEAISEYKKNISVGMLLLFSNWFSLLILGSAKMFIQWKWGSLLFGKISFSLSISNLFIAFISAVSIVLFPMLKRMENDKLPSLYFYIRKGLTTFLLIAMLFYFPCRNILNYFLPAYKEGVEYLGVLLPVVAFTSKITLLTNTYLKTYRKEREMNIFVSFFFLFSFI